MNLNEAVEKAARDLVPGYSIKIHIEKDAGFVQLFDQKDQEILVNMSDLDLAEQVGEAVFVAKIREAF
jgi:hypothetical protein